MSEYQYYEFLAVDRPLDDRQQAEVRSLSTRASITATRFVNEYHWGNFRGDPRRMMERYYDAHLYRTNWGTHRIMLRLHVEDGLSVAEVARSLGEEQKALYRKRDALYKKLRLDLEAEGIRQGDAHELLSTLDWESALTVDVAARGES